MKNYGAGETPTVEAYLHINKSNPVMRGVSLHHDASCTNTLCDVEPLIRRSTHEAIVEARVAALEGLRPHWAQGYSSDSIAAQTCTAALSQIWEVLGVDNQTDTMMRLTEVLRDAKRYRTLRSMHWYSSPLCVVKRPARSVRPGFDCPSGDRLDEMLDLCDTKESP